MTEKQMEMLEMISVIGAIPSLMGGLFIVTTYAVFPKIREKMAYSLITYIAIADGIRSFANTWGAPSEESGFCELQGFLKNFAGIASLTFVSSVCGVMYTTIFHVDWWQITAEQKMKRKLYLNLFAWTFALCLSSLPLLTGSYGNLGPWCWIEGETHIDHIWRWVCFYGVLFLVFVMISSIYIRVYKFMRDLSTRLAAQEACKKARKERQTRTKKMFNRIRWYPAIMLICYFWAFLRRLINVFGVEPPFWMAVLHVGFSGVYGLGNALVYGFTTAVIQSWKQKFEDISYECTRFLKPGKPSNPAKDLADHIETGGLELPAQPTVADRGGQTHTKKLKMANADEVSATGKNNRDETAASASSYESSITQ